MKFVSLMGPIEDIERVKETYLTNCDIQIENAVAEIGEAGNVTGFAVVNIYADALRKAERFAELAGIECAEESRLTSEEANRIIDSIDALLQDNAAKVSDLTLEKKHCEDMRKELEPFIELEFPLESLVGFHFIKYRFGRIPVNSFRQFEAYLSDTEGLLMERSSVDADYVYCVYFVPEPLYEKVSAIFSSLHFEPVNLSYELKGTPGGAYRELTEKIKILEAEIRELEAEQAKQLMEHGGDIALALRKLKELSGYTEMQRYAARTKDDFYIICGWMAQRDAKKLEKTTEGDDEVVVILEDHSEAIRSAPPTKLKNIGIVRPFEQLIKMYGLPAYGEIDPTVFFGVSYSILFGMMFGDLGQGIALSLIGYVLYRFYHVQLGSVISIVGLSSAFFGLMYGSVFGYEDLIPTFWISPMHDINTVLMVTLIFGIVLNITSMAFHIANGIKNKDKGKIFFDPNGISGLVFYVAVLIIALLAYTGVVKITKGLVLTFIGLPLLLIMFREPITNFVEGKKEFFEGKTSDFVTGLFFETFEILLSYATNTISFIRVGAFALCHAGMMSVVLMLAGAGENNLGDPLIMLLGNIFVMCLEGLVVGIQCLRLQYYEMFSRFFTGGGREFKSFKNMHEL